MDEQAQQLKTYIREQLQSGLEPDEVQAHLQASGWPAETVKQAFLEVQASLVPTSFQANAGPNTAAVPVTQQEASQSAPAPQAAGTKRGRIKTGWLLLKQSIRVLNGNRYLLRYLLMTYVWVMVLTIILVVIYVIDDNLLLGTSDDPTPLGYGLAFVNYLVIYFVINFYAAALAANMLEIFQGKRTPYRTHIKLARSKAPALLVFALIEATVGLILRFLVERIRFIGWILAWLLGTAWSLGTMFVLPIIVTSDTGAPKAIKQSVKFFKSTWGENITAKVTVNAPIFLINLAVLAVFWTLFFVAISVGSFALLFTLIIAYCFVQLTIAVIGSFANSLINVSLFYYATYHQVPPSFSADLLNQVFVPKKPGRFFNKG